MFNVEEEMMKTLFKEVKETDLFNKMMIQKLEKEEIEEKEKEEKEDLKEKLKLSLFKEEEMFNLFKTNKTEDPDEMKTLN